MPESVWFLVIGGLLLGMAVATTLLQRLPLSTAIVYLVFGFALGPTAVGAVSLRFHADAQLLLRLAEVVILLSLFSAGLKLRVPLTDRRWLTPLRLVTAGMLVTIGAVALAGHFVFGLTLPLALLLGAALAPTDPVLASEVEVEHAFDGNRLRFGLTGEAGMNDGAAQPFVLLALGLLGSEPLGTYGARWIAVDLLYGSVGGVALGLGLGFAAAKGIVWLRTRQHLTVGVDEFLALGLIALTYGLSQALGMIPFLSVFAAGVAIRQFERATRQTPDEELPDFAGLSVPPSPRPLGPGTFDDDPVARDHPAADPRRAAAFLAAAMLSFTTRLERLGEAVIVATIGLLLSTAIADDSSGASWWPAVGLAAFGLLVARPASIAISLIGCDTGWRGRGMLSWFGVRGVASIFYVAFVISHGLDGRSPELLRIGRAVLVAIAASIVVHGASVTPLMRWYNRGAARAAD